ncbi:MAG: hypothetical protein WCW87_04065 [Candidatus Paceibacterota bacterium]
MNALFDKKTARATTKEVSEAVAEHQQEQGFVVQRSFPDPMSDGSAEYAAWLWKLCQEEIDAFDETDPFPDPWDNGDL